MSRIVQFGKVTIINVPTPETLNDPPFPEMIWTQFDWWEGKTWLAEYGNNDRFFKRTDGKVELRLLLIDPETSRIPCEAQANAFTFLRERGGEVVASVLDALLPYYKDYGAGVDYGGFEEECAPTIADINDFKPLMKLSEIYIHPWIKDDLAYTGLSFKCTWEEEHGFGVLLHGARVVNIGFSEEAFDWKPKQVLEESVRSSPYYKTDAQREAALERIRKRKE